MNLALLSLFLAAFSIGTTEFVVTGLLPAISRDLGVSISEAGLLVGGYAAGVAVGGPILSLLTSRFPRKTMILVLMAIFVGGHVLCALAPNYPLLMAARLVVSMSHGSFFGLAAIIAVSLVPPERRGAAISLVFAGITVANILGVPGGTAIGNAVGWRATFWIVGGIAIVAAAAMAILVPRDGGTSGPRSSLADQFRVLGNQRVYLSYAIIVVMMIGFFTTFTYIAPFLTEVSHVPAEWVALVLLCFGIGSTIGIFIGGRLADRIPRRVLMIGLPIQGLVYLTLALLGSSTWLAPVIVCCMGLAGFAVGATVQNRILLGAARAPDLASTLISSMFNLGIATGAWLGATLIANGVPYASLPLVAVATSCVTTILGNLAASLDRRDALAPQPAAA